MEMNKDENILNANNSKQSLSPVNNSNQSPSPVNNSNQSLSPVNNSNQSPSPVNNSNQSPSPVNISNQSPSPVNISSRDDSVYKDISLNQKSEQSNNISDLSNGNDPSLSDSVNSDIAISCNEISELEITNATCESLDNNFQTGNSDDTLEISNCFSEADTSNAVPGKRDTSMSSCSEMTEDQIVSEMLLYSSPIKTEVSSMSVNETSAITNDDSEGSSSDLSPDEQASSEDDSASDGMIDLADMYPTAVKWQFRNNNPQLPETVTVLTAPGGSKVYLVGTAHFSEESQEDVAKTIRATQPDIVVLELCKSRVNILTQDEAAVLEESRNINFEKIRAAIRQNGFKQGLLYILLLNVSAHLTKELGMVPGGEFRRAFLEAKQIPQCSVQLGDRPIHITLQRVLATLSIWKKLCIAWCLMMSQGPISKEDVERCKQKDLLAEMLAEMTGDFPELSEVFLRERDMYLAYSLQLAAKPRPSHVLPSGESPTVVVGVVGIGHVPGIVENWNTVSESDILPIISIPEASTSSKFVYGVIRYSTYGLIIYGCYRLIPGSIWQKPINAIGHLLKR